jgi:hypothetical protein
MSGPTLEGLAEDIADLKAENQGFAAELEMQKSIVDGLRESSAPAPATDESALQATLKNGKHHGADGKRTADSDAPAVPPFLLRLDGAMYYSELGALAEWVTELLVPTYMREPGSLAPWCPQWWEHPEAVARLHALWLAWQELTDPETGGRTGPAVWHRDYLDPCMAHLRDPQGPFCACMVTDKPQHRVLPPPPVAECPYLALLPQPGTKPEHAQVP